MILRYFSSRPQPIIPMVVDDYTTGRIYVFPMLLDTGADRTAFPAAYAAFIGHDNLSKKVVTLKIGGIGGKSDSYAHSVRVGFFDPVRSTAQHLIRSWTSSLDKALFVEKLTTPTGLLGRDVMREWKRVAFFPVRNQPDRKWEIVVEV